ncbi:hypothetical protein DVS77_21675 [Mycolicibacterium moriokaense]|nr:hypothetical protein DVS77_21675 [Mycolicibacterium moriokaense]
MMMMAIVIETRAKDGLRIGLLLCRHDLVVKSTDTGDTFFAAHLALVDKLHLVGEHGMDTES